MDLFFNLRNTYSVNDTFENVKDKVDAISRSGFGRNITGKLNNDNSFKFTPRWTFGSVTILGMHQDLTYLKGKIERGEDGVVVNIKTHPNYVMVFFFYCCLAGIIYGIFDWISFKGHYRIESSPLLVACVFSLILPALMLFGTIRLRNRFESMMKLKPHKSTL